MRVRTGLYTMVGIYIFQWLLVRWVDIYGIAPWFDVPMHLAGGFAVGMVGIALHHNITDKHHIDGTPFWYHILFVVGFVSLIAIAWEFHEYLIDNTVGLWYDWPQYQLSLTDTMSDLGLSAFGGFVAACVFRKEW